MGRSDQLSVTLLCGVGKSLSRSRRRSPRSAPHNYRRQITHKMWCTTFDAGIPHVRFCAGAPSNGCLYRDQYTHVEYARFADDLVILIDAHRRHDWLIGAVNKRLREEFDKLQVEINDEKSRMVDLERGESFGFLGFDFRYLRSLRGAWRPHYTPKLKKRTALMRELKAVFRRYRSQPIERVINLINPVLRGWVNYFAVGHSSECFSFIKDWVEKKVRRHLAHAQKRKGLRLEAME